MATLIPVIRASLQARIERLLAQPVIARIDAAASDRLPRIGTPTPADAVMDMFADRYASQESRSSGPWQENATDDTATVRVQIDYDRRWSGDQGARAVLEAVKGALEGPIACLTDSQLALLQRAPREFLASTNRETIDLVEYDTDRVGRYPRVTALRLARLPTAAGAYAYLAIVPNLVQLARQLAALDALEAEGHEELDPLRVLVGATPPDHLAEVKSLPKVNANAAPSDALDEHQRDCAAKALKSPHFTVIEGPPGSGKTTVISSIVRRALSHGWRMLIASSTHVAVDNIVEKLTKVGADDDLGPSSTPVRFASRLKSVAPAASDYWVGSKQEHRAPTIAKRLETILSSKLPGARRLFQRIDPQASGLSPITSAIAAHRPVVCGTPIGILSCDEVSQAAPGSYDLLVVDEVSKMTVPEFLAVAVKARRWCLVGDPSQMPPFCDAAEVAATLTEILSDEVELVCSVAAALERTKPGERSAVDLLVVAEDPVGVARAIDDHAEQVHLLGIPSVHVYYGTPVRGVLVCAPEEASAILGASIAGSPPRYHKVLVQRGVPLPAGVAESAVKDRERAGAVSIETTYYTYHALPWARRREHKLPLLGLRNGLDKYLPSPAMLEALRTIPQLGSHGRDMAGSELAIAQRFAIHCTSVYDWLTGIPTHWFSDVPLLRRLAAVVPEGLAPRVQPFVGRLARQYRMHPSLSAVPRDLFYFNESLRDGIPDDAACCVRFMQVVGEATDNGEASASEAKAIADVVPRLLAVMTAEGSIMVITPYLAQERVLRKELAAIDNRRVEICTLDRCQGREADYVFISLVRDRATPFLDMPKRWNVALTRARKKLVFVGNVDNYLREAHRARTSSRPGEPTKSSLLALVLDSYDRLLSARHAR